MAAKAFGDRTIPARGRSRGDQGRNVVAHDDEGGGPSLVRRPSRRYPRRTRVHPIGPGLGHSVERDVHRRIVDDIEAVGAGYGNPGNAARENDVVGDGHICPETVKDRDALQRNGKRKICDGLALDIVAVDNDVLVGDAELVVPVPALNSVVMDAFLTRRYPSRW